MVKYPTINIAQLRRIVDALLLDAEQKLGPVLRLDHDYYWHISSPELYELGARTGDLKQVGSLGDDWEFLHDMGEDAVYPMLVHVAPLLRYLADKPDA